MLSVRVVVGVVVAVFRFHSITFEGMYGFHSNFAELKFCKIQVKFDIGSHPPNFGRVMALFRLTFCCSFPLNNFWRDVAIPLKLCRTLYQRKIQVKFDIGNHPQNFSWVMALFQLTFCSCVDFGFRSITFAGMHWFYWKFAEGYINVKYRSSSILIIIRKILAKLWPFFDIVFVVGVKYKVKILFPLNNFWKDALLTFEVCSEELPLGLGAIIRTNVFCCFFPFSYQMVAWRFKQATHPILGILVFASDAPALGPNDNIKY